ncbi:MAG: hypothetical protein WCS72_03305 [Deltaproteobacteria bacterium]
MFGPFRHLLPGSLKAAHRDWEARRTQERFEADEGRAWAVRGYAAPSPAPIKRAVLQRNGLPDATWIETGTYLGDTSAFLATFARRVVTIEPDPAHAARARERFRHTPQVEVVKGLSEEVLPRILSAASGNLCLWLDGHFSGGTTFQGPQDTPIADELAAVAANLPRFPAVVVLVDDVRCFQAAKPGDGYPPLDFLVDWARTNAMSWHVEHDIFVAGRGG